MEGESYERGDFTGDSILGSLVSPQSWHQPNILFQLERTRTTKMNISACSQYLAA
jgi:hypothetical protein